MPADSILGRTGTPKAFGTALAQKDTLLHARRKLTLLPHNARSAPAGAGQEREAERPAAWAQAGVSTLP